MILHTCILSIRIQKDNITQNIPAARKAQTRSVLFLPEKFMYPTILLYLLSYTLTHPFYYV
jgi:hypothetical protein